MTLFVLWRLFYPRCNASHFLPTQPRLLEDGLRRKSRRRKFGALPRVAVVSWGPFLEIPSNFSDPKSNIEIEISRIRARVLASKQLSFVSLTYRFIMLDAKLLKPLSCM